MRKTLANTFDWKNNAIGFIRLSLAIVVLLCHCVYISGHPIKSLIFNGPFAVDGFFVLSGFLIAASYANSKSLINFIWRRIARIYPGFWACLILSGLIFYPAIHLLTYRDFNWDLTEGISYIFNNFTLIYNQTLIAGFYRDMGFNGSLWTLQYEFLCYLLIPIFFLLPRKVFTILTGLIYAYFCFNCHVETFDSSVWRFLPFFMSGVAVFFAQKLIVLDNKIFASCFVLLQISYQLDAKYCYAIAPLVYWYVLMFLACYLPFKSIEKRGDFSYGIYLYHQPLMRIAAFLNAGILGLIAVTLLLSSVAAYLSFRFVEKPFLSLKYTARKLPIQPHQPNCQGNN